LFEIIASAQTQQRVTRKTPREQSREAAHRPVNTTAVPEGSTKQRAMDLSLLIHSSIR
jgi:hypothetical protein